MQQAIIVKDNTSLEKLNDILATEEHYIETISANPNGSWLVILDEADDFELSELENMFEEEATN